MKRKLNIAHWVLIGSLITFICGVVIASNATAEDTSLVTLAGILIAAGLCGGALLLGEAI